MHRCFVGRAPNIVGVIHNLRARLQHCRQKFLVRFLVRCSPVKKDPEGHCPAFQPVGEGDDVIPRDRAESDSGPGTFLREDRQELGIELPIPGRYQVGMWFSQRCWERRWLWLHGIPSFGTFLRRSPHC